MANSFWVAIVIVCFALATQVLCRPSNERQEAEEILHRAKRVIGGDEATMGEFPYLASIRGKVAIKKYFGITFKSKKFYCGAALISDQWLLTAAHCILAQDGSKTYDMRAGKHWKVRLSAIKIKASIKQKVKNILGKIFRKKSWWQFEYKVEAAYTHPDYNSKSIDNDIALLKLKKKVPYKEVSNIDLMSLPNRNINANWPTVGQTCRFVGWGCQKKGGSVSQKAYKVNLPIINDQRCYSVYGRYYVQDDDFCAGYFSKGKSICQGDSGGALVCDDPQGRARVAGVASAVHAARPGQYPAIFTRVSTHLGWINRTMRENK